MTTGLVWDERFMWHDSGTHFGPPSEWLEPAPHLESPESKRRVKNLLDASGMTARLTPIAARPATQEELLRAHTMDYLARIRAIAEGGGGNIAKFATTNIAANGYDVAALSAGGAIAATEAVLDGTIANAYALIRPPGHHAEPEDGKGFCVFANAAIAALHALEARGLSRVAIVDWDAHHGNGTQAVFWEDPRVLAVSIHEDGVFPPNSGPATDVGEGPGKGFTINIPLPPGSGEGAYMAAFDRVIEPALRDFAPELILVPCGFDPGFHDPLARMLLSSDSFRRMTERILALAGELCGGRLVLLHEGGYEIHSVPFMALAVLEALTGARTGVEDPFLPAAAGSAWHALQPHQEAAVEAARKAHAEATGAAA